MTGLRHWRCPECGGLASTPEDVTEGVECGPCNVGVMVPLPALDVLDATCLDSEPDIDNPDGPVTVVHLLPAAPPVGETPEHRADDDEITRRLHDLAEGSWNDPRALLARVELYAENGRMPSGGLRADIEMFLRAAPAREAGA